MSVFVGIIKLFTLFFSIALFIFFSGAGAEKTGGEAEQRPRQRHQNHHRAAGQGDWARGQAHRKQQGASCSTRS